ncbi:hypothetical protein [Kitasatospora terrestris]|uniref:Resolvase/invertase-type recombinase catalytic domain-containing protein n=1 Tax=Kitasatospora terrestris TaxID=258051 RepID=A0ABP9DDL6_9ACTN
MIATSLHRPGGAAAVYLRCFPFDSWGMAGHEEALRAYARGLGFCDPHVFLDNGRPSGGELPQLARMESLVASGHCGAVFVPGLWVFSMDDAAAGAVAERLRRLGGRVWEMPSPRLDGGGRSRAAGADPWRRGPSVLVG